VAVEVLGRERRRHWADAEKLEILAAVGLNGETLARVARCYDVSRSQIYNWRGQFKKRGLLPAPVGPTFVPVDIGAPMLNAEPA
jgi:transposase